MKLSQFEDCEKLLQLSPDIFDELSDGDESEKTAAINKLTVALRSDERARAAFAKTTSSRTTTFGATRARTTRTCAWTATRAASTSGRCRIGVNRCCRRSCRGE